MGNTAETAGEGGEYAALGDAELARAMCPTSDHATNAAAWREFARRHLGALKGFVEARARDLGEAMCGDLLSETVCRIQRGLDGYEDRGPGSFRSWCVKIAERVVLDARRGRFDAAGATSAGGPELVSFDEIAEHFTRGVLPDDADDVQALATQGPDGGSRQPSERELVMREAFCSLTPVDQTVLFGRVVHDFSDEYVAELAGKPADHVRRIKYKALKKLARAFQRLWEGRRRAS